MEHQHEEPLAYRPRTGSLQRKRAQSSPPDRASRNDEGETERAPRPSDNSARHESEPRTATRQSYFKNRTEPAEPRRYDSHDDRPQRPARKPYSDAGDERPHRSSSHSTFGTEGRREPAFNKFSKDKPRNERRTPTHSSRDEGERTYPRKPRGDWEERPRRAPGSFEKPYGNRDGNHNDKPFGERRNYDKPYGERRSYDKPYGERRSDDKPYGERRSYDKPYGERRNYDKPYGERRNYDKPYGERRSDDKPYGERRSYGKSDAGGGGKRPYGKRDDKPYGEHRSYGNSDAGGKRPYARSEHGEREGYRPRTFAPRDEQPAREHKPYREIQVKEPNAPVRLNKYIANSGVCSRREADEYIQKGEITVNGEVITTLGTKVQPADEIRWNGDKLSGEKKVYILLNKPKGYVTTVEDEHADKTVMELIAGACTERVYPVGRLDKNTTGVLLFTNDGELTKQLTHPSYSKRKVYQATLDKTLKKPDMEKLVEGVEIEDGTAIADEVGYADLEDKTVVGLEIHSGQNRVVRRMFEALGYEVKKLDRVYFAGLTKKSLERGQWRVLAPKEVSMLKMGAYE